MAGFFAQAGVSPWVLVRVVRRWPDFIFADRDATYSFVESKAFTGDLTIRSGLQGRILDGLIIEGAVDAAQQLNSDPFGKVWNCYTHICSISPMRFVVTILEFNVPDSRRQSQTDRTIPAAVADGLAERAVNQAAAQLDLVETDPRLTDPRIKRAELVPQLRGLAEKEAEALISEAGPGEAATIDRRPIIEAVEGILRRIEKRKWRPSKSQNLSGRRLKEAKTRAVQARLAPLRRSGSDTIYLADLPAVETARIRRNWSPDWSLAMSPWGRIDGTDLWRCGGAVICISGDELEGRDVSEAGLDRA
jgi:hypothetical protein